jgi:hypothetical protein
VYANFYNESNKKVQGLLEECDLDDEMTFEVFKKTIYEIYDACFEIPLSVIGDSYVMRVVADKLEWNLEFLEEAESLYHSEPKSLLKDDQKRQFLELRLLTDVLGSRFENSYLRSLLFEGKETDEFSLGLKRKVDDTIQEKIETNLAQFVFLSLFLKISTAQGADAMAIFKEVKSIHKANKDFFDKEHIKIFQEIKGELKGDH